MSRNFRKAFTWQLPMMYRASLHKAVQYLKLLKLQEMLLGVYLRQRRREKDWNRFPRYLIISIIL